jgi:nickel transport protein
MIKRDIAALNQKLDEPGLQDIMAGIGYILGLFGIGAYVASRRRDKEER